MERLFCSTTGPLAVNIESLVGRKVESYLYRFSTYNMVIFNDPQVLVD